MRSALAQIKDRKGLIGAEIGVLRGEHALEMFHELDIAELYLVDPYLPYIWNWEVKGSKEVLATFREALERLKPYEKKIRWLITPSVQASLFIEDEYLDFVYIDGNHQREYVMADIKYWMPKVKKGGMLGGHDYGGITEPELKDAVHRALERDVNVKGLDWWILK